MIAAVFIHGLGCSGRSFDSLLTHANADTDFRSRYRPVVLELPKSVTSVQSEDVFEHLANLAIMEITSAEHVAIIGHSMGGVIGLYLCDGLGARVTNFVNIEGNLSAADSGLISERLADDSSDEALDVLIKGFLQIGGPGELMWCETVKEYTYETLRQYASALRGESVNGNLLKRFNALKCNKIFMYGDDYLGNAEREENPALRNISKAEKVHMPQAGHFVMQDQPQHCWSIISAALDPVNSEVSSQGR